MLTLYQCTLTFTGCETGAVPCTQVVLVFGQVASVAGYASAMLAALGVIVVTLVFFGNVIVEVLDD